MLSRTEPLGEGTARGDAWSDAGAPATPDAATPWRLLLAITVLATVARAIGLNDGLWIDEIYSLVRSFRTPLGQILTEFWGDNHHPLYAVLAHASRGVFGESAWSIRLPALLFGVAAVPALFALGRLVVSRREALLAATLLAVSYHHVWFSQNARGYSAIAFFAIVLMWALLRGMATGRLAYFAWYGVAAGLGAYTHLTVVLIVAGHAIAGLLVLPRVPAAERGSRFRGLLLAMGLGAALTVVLYAPMLGSVIHYFLHSPSGLQGVSTPRWALLEGIRVLVLGLSGGVRVVGAVVVVAGVLVGVAGVVSIWRRSPLFILLLVVPALVTSAGAAAARGTLYPRFFFFAIGPAIVVAVRGTFAAGAWLSTGLGRAPLTGVRLATAAVGGVIALSAASLMLDYRYPKQDYAGAMHYVLAQRVAGDSVVSIGVPADPYRTLYGQVWPNVKTAEQLDSIRASTKRTWVLYTFPRYVEGQDPAMWATLRDECASPRVFRGTVGGGDVVACLLSEK